MPRFPALVDRFRRMLLPPGRPAEALGVPAAGDDLAVELRPLDAELDRIELEVTEIEQRGHEEARGRRERAERECAAILRQARTSAAAERLRVAAECVEEARRHAAAIRTESRREAERIGAQQQQAVAALVAEVVECVRRTGR